MAAVYLKKNFRNKQMDAYKDNEIDKKITKKEKMPNE